MFNPALRGVLREGEGTGTGGGGNPPAFDSAAFKAELMGEFTKMFQGGLKALKTDVGKLIETAVKAKAGDPPADPPADPPPGDPPPNPDSKLKGGDPETNARFARMEREMATLRKDAEESKKKEAEAEAKAKETDRVAKIREALSGFQFADEASAADAYSLIQSHLKWDEDGASLIADSDKGPVTAKEFAAQFFESRPRLLAPKGGGGAGAKNGRPIGGFDPTDMANLDRYASLKPDEQAAVNKHISDTATAAMGGKR